MVPAQTPQNRLVEKRVKSELCQRFRLAKPLPATPPGGSAVKPAGLEVQIRAPRLKEDLPNAELSHLRRSSISLAHRIVELPMEGCVTGCSPTFLAGK